MDKKTKNYSGMTLMETIINIYIYVLLVLICMTVSLTYLKARISIRQTQQSVEELSIAMNEMGKKIRMSTCRTSNFCCPGGSCTTITVVPNGGSGNLIYRLEDSTKKLYVTPPGGTEELFMDNVGGEFTSINDNTSNDRIPLITIHLYKTKNGSTINGTDVQTSISLRSGYSQN